MAVGGDLEHALFSRPEMERRYATARQGMTRCGFDALLISGEENFHSMPSRDLLRNGMTG